MIDADLFETATGVPGHLAGDPCPSADYLAFSADCAAARRAIGTRNGEQDT